MAPVMDHEVHEKVRVGSEFSYGCNNRLRNFKTHYFATDRIYFANGNFRSIDCAVPHTMSHECRFDLSLTDPACNGCIHRGSGESYAEKIRSLGK